jgi:hypothetical protein
MKENHQASTLFDRYISWHAKLSLSQKFALAYTTLGVSELVTNVKASQVKKITKRVGFVSLGCGALIVCASVSHNIDQAQTTAQTTAEVASAPAYTRWNNPNVKPFAESPYYQGGYTDTVYWDESTQQWYCKVEQHGATRCQDAEGETKEQIAEAGAKARAGRAELDAQQRALNEYWCGAFEDPKKTGCREL